jgi:hypothetical protein
MDESLPSRRRTPGRPPRRTADRRVASGRQKGMARGLGPAFGKIPDIVNFMNFTGVHTRADEV